jgi:hypothetical protein
MILDRISARIAGGVLTVVRNKPIMKNVAIVLRSTALWDLK